MRKEKRPRRPWTLFMGEELTDKKSEWPSPSSLLAPLGDQEDMKGEEEDSVDQDDMEEEEVHQDGVIETDFEIETEIEIVT